MKQKSEQDIMSAVNPSDIFTMNQDTIDEEKDEYLKLFRSATYSTIDNFLIKQKIILLYRQAISVLQPDYEQSELVFCTTSISGEKFQFEHTKSSSFKLGQQYVTSENVIFALDEKYKSYYENYINKTKMYSKPDKHIWQNVVHMVPNVINHFKNLDGQFIIILKKPCAMYSLRDLMDYFGGKLEPLHVASILTRLYYFACYMDLVDMAHNGITVNNLYFSLGKFVEAGKSHTLNDMRIVGVFGGWFFTTYSDEKINGLPSEVYEVLPADSKITGFSSYKVDACSIKRVARELLGDITGNNLGNVPDPFCDWVNNSKVAENAYAEFCNWRDVRKKSFGTDRFISMDVSI